MSPLLAASVAVMNFNGWDRRPFGALGAPPQPRAPRLYRELPCLHRQDDRADGFHWLAPCADRGEDVSLSAQTDEYFMFLYLFLVPHEPIVIIDEES